MTDIGEGEGFLGGLTVNDESKRGGGGERKINELVGTFGAKKENHVPLSYWGSGNRKLQNMKHVAKEKV